MEENTQMFADIKSDQELKKKAMVIESMCINCEENGKTTLLMVTIPMFKQIILMSFCCETCGYRNSEVQFGGKLNDYASRITLKVKDISDFKRDCVKSEHCTIRISELDLEIPSSGKGSVNTIEGFLMNAVQDLESDQEERKVKIPEMFEKIKNFIEKLNKLIEGKAFPFTFIFEDPSGNSFIKNPYAPHNDPNLHIEKISRTKEQLEAMGYSAENAIMNINQEQMDTQKVERIIQLDAHRVDFSKPLTEDVKGESLVFKVPCHSCGLEGEQKMCSTSIPYFKELIIMSFLCGFCGSKSTEVKPGGEMSALGRKIVLKVETQDDLRRDIYKSETCFVEIPELELELQAGTLGGVYTTVEGLLEKIQDNLVENNPFVGDSVDPMFKVNMDKFIENINKIRNLESKFVIIFRDIGDNSFIQNPYFPNNDPRVISETFERTFEDNEELGINDMKVENYGEQLENNEVNKN
ncbi:zinc finger protein 259, putative [Ichthyophthirius multifiliis]|uniref:Zinc finger protein 259, putative n=1 Tax=Ichthyophthirius multifiliis TaxID=5932 RepID=G0R1G7_ICHMU|nr:zinc finger protein 259, putative [Ichthyophthirius multifiliis]EGR28690.1 zinc finger protein 259, putative [Ichthyophthirius multifiliis]|eukprot:XP_004029926.1 zinc finger protein 259, putative [Ichthyophthirius multifiliis]